MEANKSDCEKCIKIAKTAKSNGENEKAIRFLEKAQKLYPTDEAKHLLDELNKINTDGDKFNNSNNENDDINQNNNNNNHSDEYNDINASSSSTSTKQNHSTTPKSSPKTKRRKPQQNQDQHKPSTTDYTSEQLDAVKRVKNCKDFYEILGVTKQATEADLKKQYRRLALQFHPDKNKAPGATDAFKLIGKAFAILNDTQKRKHYDLYGPESFDSSSSSTANRRASSNTYQTYSNNYWSDDDFSAEEIFNMFFGGGYANAAASHRQRSTRHHHHNSNGGTQTNFVYTQSNNYALLFQLMPILMIVVLSLFSSLMMGEPVYSLHRTNKYNVKRQTNDHQILYYVKNDFKVENSQELKRLEKQIEEDLNMELRQNCFREKSYKDTAIWRARTYGDERLIKRAMEIDTPSCDKINSLFNNAGG